MNKFFLFRGLAAAFICGLLIWDGLQLLTHSAHTLPEGHKELLLIGALLWTISAFINQNSNDDDWAGQL